MRKCFSNADFATHSYGYPLHIPISVQLTDDWPSFARLVLREIVCKNLATIRILRSSLIGQMLSRVLSLVLSNSTHCGVCTQGWCLDSDDSTESMADLLNFGFLL